jgi:propionate CoA-transferase
LKVKIENGTVTIVQEGKTKKFVNQLDQITFSGSYAAKQDKKVLYITERAVFELTREGLHLIELAPGIDLQRDVLDQMEFAPIVDTYKTMDPRLFADGLMGLKQ